MKRKWLQTNQITEIAILLAMAVVIELAFMVLPRQPQGGSVSLTMLPLLIIAYRHGLKIGVLSGVIYGFLDLMLSGFTLYHWGSLFLDYLFAFGVLGLASLLFYLKKDSRKMFVLGIIFGGFLRFFMHFLSGAILFGEFAPEGTPVLVYSLVYNGTYMAGSILLCVIVGFLIFKRIQSQTAY